MARLGPGRFAERSEPAADGRRPAGHPGAVRYRRRVIAPGAQRLDHLGGTRVPGGPVAGYHPLQDSGHFGWNLRANLPDRVRIAAPVGEVRVRWAVRERGATREQEVERGPEGEHIGPSVHGMAIDHLFRGVAVDWLQYVCGAPLW